MKHTRTSAIPTAVVEELRKILSFASSAGDTITNRDALEVIKAICRSRLFGDDRARALASHADRVREVIRG